MFTQFYVLPIIQTKKVEARRNPYNMGTLEVIVDEENMTGAHQVKKENECATFFFFDFNLKFKINILNIVRFQVL
ncbi:hypothetical protein RCL_jg1166.t1 [Rhizophagus clarus]|uniref:Uncharacterized protein n=1 Tax=Rhizophagus clarus TaxID=94130 RepID=A0A8H3QEB4_9GLOM|nr:hypothetical protein RCL_jg1166.t1 [Rhizophagus clarus]